jgi:glycosyltransferase involved in cell wall biosynthesis
MAKSLLLSVVVPVYNENLGLLSFHAGLLKATKQAVRASYEIIYCDDGSNDGTSKTIFQLCKKDPKVRLIKLSRNFGKENAMSAGIAAARGQAVLTIDGDGQHPVNLIPDFVSAWQSGAQVVVGVREGHNGAQDLLYFMLCLTNWRASI